MNTTVKIALALFVVASSIVTAGPTAAADYPTKPIRMILPAAVGNASDTGGRLVASELSKQMGHQVIVDNRPGASGIIGLEVIAKSAPDGYAFGFATFPFITNPLVYLKLPYDTAKDFQPVVLSGFGANLMSVTPALPVRSVRELIEYARAQPGKLSYGTGGAGSVMTLSAELFMSPAVSERAAANGLVIVGGTPEQFAEHLRRETVKYAGVIKAAGIKPQ